MQTESRISLSKFQKWIEKASLERWGVHSGDTLWEIQTVEPDNKVKVYGQWMVIILVYCPEVKGTFKLFYSSSDFSDTMGGMLVDDNLIRDFIKEYSNLMAGAIQRIFEAYQVRVGISLPVVTRGFDSYFEPPHRAEIGSLIWALVRDNRRIICQFTLEVFGQESLTKLQNEPRFEIEIKNGQVEFL